MPRQFVGPVRDAELWTVWLQGPACLERSGITTIESMPVDEMP
jgi:hypothetical protein